MEIRPFTEQITTIELSYLASSENYFLYIDLYFFFQNQCKKSGCVNCMILNLDCHNIGKWVMKVCLSYKINFKNYDFMKVSLNMKTSLGL